MLPPGHLSAGFLTGYALLNFFRPYFTTSQINQLLLWATFFGFAPDLDYFYSFYKEKALVIKDTATNNHRKFVSHAPILWLVAGLIVYFFSTSNFYKVLGLIIWLASWSHFLLDSIEYGVMWLWPISTKKFTLIVKNDVKTKEQRFWFYWWQFLKQYSKTVSFYLEILIILTSLIIYIR